MQNALLFSLLGGAVLALVVTLNALVALLRVRVPFVRTPGWVADWLAATVTLPAGATFAELGCGDARVLAGLARRNPQARFVGYEVALWPLALARLRTLRLPNVSIRHEDFRRVALAELDVLFCYLVSGVMPQLEARLRRELRPGAIVYSYTFEFPNWRPSGAVADPSDEDHPRLWWYVQT